MGEAIFRNKSQFSAVLILAISSFLFHGLSQQLQQTGCASFLRLPPSQGSGGQGGAVLGGNTSVPVPGVGSGGGGTRAPPPSKTGKQPDNSVNGSVGIQPNVSTTNGVVPPPGGLNGPPPGQGPNGSSAKSGGLGNGKFSAPPNPKGNNFADSDQVVEVTTFEETTIEARSLEEPSPETLDFQAVSAPPGKGGPNRGGAKTTAPSGRGSVFTATQPSKTIHGGNGICGTYNTDNQLGVCLFSGLDKTGENPAKSGWLNGVATQNCGAQVEVFRASNPQLRITAKVVDGCGLDNNDFNTGCSNLFITKALFNALKPDAKEQEAGHIEKLSWDFKGPAA